MPPIVDEKAESATLAPSIRKTLATLRAGQWGLAISVVVLAALATWNSAHKSLWMDEGYTEFTTRVPAMAATRAMRYELQPPLYSIVLAVWREMNHSIMFGRAFSTLAAVAFVLVITAAARRIGITRWWLIGIAAAFTPGVVWAGSELRMYALVLLLAALITYFYVGIVLGDGRLRRSDAIGYVVASTVGLYTFYYVGFVLAGQWIATLVARRRVALMTALLAIVGCALLPLVPTILWQVRAHPVDAIRDVDANASYAAFKTAAVLLSGFAARAEVLTWPHAIPVFLAIAVAIPILRTETPRVPWDRNEVVLTVAALTPLVILAALRLFVLAPVHLQHSLLTLPGLLLIYGVWIQRTRVGWPRFVEVGALAATTLTCLVSYQRHSVQREDWRSAALYIAAHASPGDGVLIYDPDRMLPFNDYFQRVAPSISVHGVPVDVNVQKYDPFSYAIRDTAMVAARVQSLHMLDHPVWFVVAAQLLYPLQHSPALVQDYLMAHDRLDAPVLFQGVRIIRAQPNDSRE